MSSVLISFLFTLGASAWIYNKIQRNTGNNTQSSLVVSGVAAVLIFIFFWSLFSLFVK